MSLIYLHTKNTTYVLRLMPSGKIEHIYYGRRIKEDDKARCLIESQKSEYPHSVVYNKNYGRETLDTLSLEYSENGKGDFRESAIIVYGKVGYVNDFIYQSHRVYEGKTLLCGLPSANPYNEKCTTLEITLWDASNQTEVILYYHSFYETDVITRYVKVTNKGEKAITLKRVMSLQLDLEDTGYSLVSFQGEWAREMQMRIQPVISGVYTIDSKVGVSSSKHNPFVILRENGCTETHGDCYGFNLIYSGNHAEIVEVNSYDKVRVLVGINPHCFDYTLEKEESFISPEAVLTFSPDGMNGLSQKMHKFIKKHIIPKRFQGKERPILLNNWEATYFDFNKEILLELAKEAKKVGVELFVLDDGWFGNREDDTSSLGDWYVNEEKLGGSLDDLVRKVNEIGLQFGIWIEPEMISEKSELYNKHPEWALGKIGERLCEGRNQYILDLTRQDVCDYLVEVFTKLLSSTSISYVKWDMNRNFSDTYSNLLPLEKQGEVCHRYILGFYNVVRRLTEAFPHILFEGCAAGGNRFDLGVLCYMPQIWASDNTDAHERISIQRGLSYGYPQCTYGAHVSTCPNHQTGRYTSVETRFNVAAFGLLGYELNLLELTELEKETIKNQIDYYKKHRKLLQFGQFYRLEQGKGKELYMILEESLTEGIIAYYQALQAPNPNKEKIKTSYLDNKKYYHIASREQWIQEKDFGEHSKDLEERSVARERFEAWGDHLNYAGFNLSEQTLHYQPEDTTRIIGDFGSRLYYISER